MINKIQADMKTDDKKGTEQRKDTSNSRPTWGGSWRSFAGSGWGHSYFTFLSRNKLYAAINVFGLSISLMFVLIIGVYNMQERGVDRGIGKLDRIYTLNIRMKDSTLVDGNHHYVLKLVRQCCPEVVATAGAGRHEYNMKRPDGEVIKTNIMVADTALFSILDFHFVNGNAACPLPDAQSAVITRGFAKKWFGDYDPMGKSITLRDSISFRVSAVIDEPTNMSLQPADMYISYPNMKYFNGGDMDEYMNLGINAAGMDLYVLTNGETDFRTKEAALNEYLSKNFVLYDKDMMGNKVVITPLKDHYFTKMELYHGNTRHGDSVMVNLLFAVGVVILLFAMINYVNLTVSQSSRRAKEMATRRLFGSSRFGIVTKLMGESVALCLVSLAIAVLLTIVASPYVGKLLSCSLDLWLLLRPLPILVTLLFVVVVGMLSGILPSMILSRIQPIEVVRGTFKFHAKMRLSKAFIVIQNVATIVMLGSAMTMTMQMRHIINAPLGFDTQSIMSVPAAVWDTNLDNAFINELRKQPCVTAVATADFSLVDGGNNITQPSKVRTKSAQVFTVDEHFIDFFGLKKTKDNGLKGYPRVWVNKHYTTEWAEEYQKAHSLNNPFRNFDAPIAGVLEDFRVKDITNELTSVMLFEQKELETPSLFFIKVNGDEQEAYNTVKRIYKETFHSDMDIDNPYIDQQIAAKFDREVRMSKIVGLFAFIAVVISMLGLIAMSTYFIQQRQKEIAVRKVFGSTGTQIRRRLIRSFMVYVAVAAVIAIPLTWYAMSEWIAAYAYRIAYWHWIALACLLCATISLAAVYVQSYMAGNENPIRHIKDE